MYGFKHAAQSNTNKLNLGQITGFSVWWLYAERRVGSKFLTMFLKSSILAG